MICTILFSFAFGLSSLANRLGAPAHKKLSDESPCQMRCELAYDECIWGGPDVQADCLRRIQACDSKCRNSDQELLAPAETTDLETTTQQCVSVCDERYEGCLYDHQPGYHQPAPPAAQAMCRRIVNQCSSNCRQTTQGTEVADTKLAETTDLEITRLTGTGRCWSPAGYHPCTVSECVNGCELGFSGCEYDHSPGYHQPVPPAATAMCNRMVDQCSRNCRQTTQDSEVADTKLAETPDLEITIHQCLNEMRCSECVDGCDYRAEGCLFDHMPGYHIPAPPAAHAMCTNQQNQCHNNCRRASHVTEVAEKAVDTEGAEKAVARTNLGDVFSPCVSGCLDNYQYCLYNHQPGYHMPAPPKWQAKCSSQEKQCSSKCRSEEVLSAKDTSSVVRGLAEGAAAALKIISA